MELEGLIAAVTGGASGLGAATAAALAERGAKVVVVDLPGARDSVAPETASFAEADVTDAAQVEAAIAAGGGAQAPARRASAAPASAGRRARSPRRAPHDLELFQTVVEINLIGTFNVMRLAAAAMAADRARRDGERGVIVNTASVAAFDGQIGQAPTRRRRPASSG